MKNLILLIMLVWTTLLATGCAKDGNADEDSDTDAEGIVRQVAGNAAIGRPASWSSNCLDEACVRADVDGNYLLATEVDQTSLMWSDVPFDDGSETRLYSRYRWDDGITTTLVNINPSTHAILDVWANYSQRQSLDICVLSETCTTRLLDSLTPQQEDTIVGQFDALLGDAWPSGRNPFNDIYIADPTVDALDDMHDHLLFVVSDQALLVYDNEGTLLTQATLAQLVSPVSLRGIELATDDYLNAQNQEPEIPTGNPIRIAVSINPGQPREAPYSITVDASQSSSLNGGLTFSHELTRPDGTLERFSGERITTDILQGGDHIWVVTAVDASGRSRVQGYLIPALTGEDETPTFGGQGSCITPEYAMTANTLNICEEPQNGGQYACDTLASSSVTLQDSPAPCALQTQNGGDLLGLCTLLAAEVRVLFYVNPLRPNNTETFEEKQARFEQYCADNFGGDWSNDP